MRTPSQRRPHLRGTIVVLLACILTVLPQALAQGEMGWPRTFSNADGSTTEIPSQPTRVLSTAVSVTGTLLAIDAPVIGSGSAANGQYFAQWAAVAAERGVINVWPAGAVDLEAAYAAQPDLIMVATTGGDAALAQLAEFQLIAPTIVVDYGNQTWQSLATQLAVALGSEAETESVLADYDQHVAEVAATLSLPAGTANVISFNGPGTTNPIARIGGPHASLLEALGFLIEDPDPAWHAQAGQRADFVWAPFENLIDLSSETTFLLSRAEDDVADFVDHIILAALPSVRAGQVYGLGINSFRIDYYSSLEIVESVRTRFGH